MAARSHIRRRLRAISARSAGIALIAASLLGCQSNSDRDLIARDRRMQEDQIYALQDYITQYQQLLCRYRTENASLRRQLADDGLESPTSLQPMAQPRTTPSTRPAAPAPATPQFQTPIPPGAKELDSTPPPPTTPSDLQTPDVPPLNSSGSAAPPNDGNAAFASDNYTGSVTHASYEESTDGEAVAGSAASTTGDDGNSNCADAVKERTAPRNSTSTMLLSGEVVANSSGGPRIMVDVIPPSPDDGEQPFDGNASLMLLAMDANGAQHNVGRWDFTADDVRAAFLEGSPRPTLRFFVELPADTKANGATQLWTRLVPREGAKLLAHANIDLSNPGIFSSRTDSERTRLADELILAANCVEAPPVATKSADAAAAAFNDVPAEERAPLNDVSANINEADWATAQPGRPANLSPEVADKSGAGGWRISSEPLPSAIAQSSPAPLPQPATKDSSEPSPLLDMLPSGEQQSPATQLVDKSPRRPSWARGRDGNPPPGKIAARPSWSSKR